MLPDPAKWSFFKHLRFDEMEKPSAGRERDNPLLRSAREVNADLSSDYAVSASCGLLSVDGGRRDVDDPGVQIVERIEACRPRAEARALARRLSAVCPLPRWTGRSIKALAMVNAATLLAGCRVLDQGFLNAQGPVALHERALFVRVFVILLFVAGPVLILVPLIAWHYRLANTRRAYRPHWVFSWRLEGLIWLPPIGIVVLLAVLLWPATQVDDPYTRVVGTGVPIRVQAIGLDWKWVFIYPDQGIATVNQLAVPVGRPIAMELTSGTVMQSMLLPQLAGQIYAMGGMRTELHFAVDRPGIYLGKNTQFNGADFPRQRFQVVALPRAGYDAWLARVKHAPASLDAASWPRVAARGAQPQPLFFGTVTPRFFADVVTATGGSAHPHAFTNTAEPK